MGRKEIDLFIEITFLIFNRQPAKYTKGSSAFFHTIATSFESLKGNIAGVGYYVNSRRNVDSEKSDPQTGYEATTLRILVGCSNH